MKAPNVSLVSCLVVFSSLGTAFPAMAQEVLLSEPSRIVNETPQKSFPSSRLYWEGVRLDAFESRTFRLRAVSPTRFTSLAVAWSVSGANPPAGAFHFSFSSRTSGGDWSAPVPGEGETAPDENPSGLYWSTLYITPGGISNDELEIVLVPPSGIRLAMVQVMTADILPLPSFPRVKPDVPVYAAGVTGVPRPGIIPRKDWWGSLPPDSLDGHFGPIKITISHAVVHHTAMTNNPPDPSQEIRSIWNLHVYGNGWSDIGYNFLIDQFGNIFQGRYNPWLDSTDVQGAHATSANVKSVGVSVLGNFSPAGGGIPDPRALRSLEKLVAWRFDQRGLNPLETASIPTNLGGARVVARICGHRDVGSTECPGESLYVLLPAVRLNVQSLMSAATVREGEVPGGFALLQNYPNPFNPRTMIEYTVAGTRDHGSGVGDVKLAVYDLLGREVAVLADERKAPGKYKVTFDASALASGIYFYRINTGQFVECRKMVLMK